MAKKQKEPNEVIPVSLDATMLFESAWEVCNQVGGIYTVIRSKVPSVMNKRKSENYCLLGPYIPQQVGAEFEPINDLSDNIGQTVQQMRDLGFDVQYGYWLVTGHPRVVLFNPYHVFYRLGEMKYQFWDHHKIALSDEELMNKVVSFGFQVQEFLTLFCKNKENLQKMKIKLK